MMRTRSFLGCKLPSGLDGINDSLFDIFAIPQHVFLFLRGNQHNWLLIAKHCPIQSKEEKSFLRKRLPSSILHPSCWLDFWTYPIGSMYCIFTYIYHKNQPNVGKYTSPMDPMAYGYQQIG